MSPTLHFHPLKVRALARHHDCGRNKSGVCARWQYIIHDDVIMADWHAEGKNRVNYIFRVRKASYQP